MHQIYPAACAVEDSRLAALYAYPDLPPGTGHWVRANMAASLDGAASVAGRSGGLSGPADRHVFALQRFTADVILVGAGTARAEHYAPVLPSEGTAWSQCRRGRPATPPIAVVTSAINLDLTCPLLTSAPSDARTIVITTDAAPPDRRAAVAKTADVIIAGDEQVSLPQAVGELARRGYPHILVEGGPHLLAQLAAEGLIDELCLTVSPQFAGPGQLPLYAAQALLPPSAEPGRFRLAHVLEDEGSLLCRYLPDVH